MPVIQVKDMQHILKPGQTRLGAGPGVDVSVSDDASLGVQAVLDLAGDNQVVIRRGRDGANVRVNGVALGVEPTPLMHGDKLDVNGVEVLFSEDKKIGATHFVSAAEVAAAASKRSGPARATAGTGGRLVSLVDGKEYQIPASGIVFGREAGSDVVVAQPEVSRRHASIVSTEQGYVLQDLSTNGVWVNGSRVQGSQLLARADVVRVGTEEFRFYADVAQPPPKSGAQTPAHAAPRVAPAVDPTAASIASAPRSAPAAVADPSPPVTASTPPSSNPDGANVVSPASGARLEPVTVPTPPAASQQAPSAPAAASMPPAEPTKRVTTIPRAEGPSAPSPTGGGVRAAKARPKPTSAPVKVEKSGGVPTWLWIIIIIIVGAAAYFIGQGRG